MPTLITVPEQRLLSQFESPALEQLRAFALASLSTEASPADRARNVVRRALGTDLRMLFAALEHPPGYLDAPLVAPRRLADVALELDTVRPHVEPALRELGALGLAEAYRNVLRHHLESDSFRAVISALCATVLIAALFTLES